MIIQALKQYYERKSADSDEIAPFGWELNAIKYIIVLDKSGTVVGLENKQIISGKDKHVTKFIVPQGVKRTSGAKSNLLWDNAEYVLGMDEDGNQADGKKHELFRKELEEKLGDVDDDGLRAVKKFVALSFDEKLEQLKKCDEIKNLLKDGTTVNLSFRLVRNMRLVFESETVKKRINEIAAPFGSTHKGRCLITGQEEPIANLHPAIKGVFVSKGKKMGTNIVGYNQDAFCSFGKEQGDNAPIGISTTFAYTTALNTLLLDDSPNKLIVGKTTVVFWSGEKTKFELDLKEAIDPDQDIEKVQNLYEAPDKGTMPILEEQEKDIKMYVLGLFPNSARLAIRFWINSSVGKMYRCLEQYFKDIDINRATYDHGYLTVSRLLDSVSIRNKNKDKDIPSRIECGLISAILDGTNYPYALFINAIERSRAERKITWERAAILKAYLNRKWRLSKEAENNLDNTNNQTQLSQEKEIIKVLDYENNNVGYCLGRLFATMEKIQGEANKKSTISDRFFGSVSITPASVIPNLTRLMKHHLSKIDNPGLRISLDKLVSEITGKISFIPATLSLEEQGQFDLGYYHQRNDFYTKKTDSSNTDSSNDEESK